MCTKVLCKRRKLVFQSRLGEKKDLMGAKKDAGNKARMHYNTSANISLQVFFNENIAFFMKK